MLRNARNNKLFQLCRVWDAASLAVSRMPFFSRARFICASEALSSGTRKNELSNVNSVVRIAAF